MNKFIEVTGKSEEEAVASALAQLGLDRFDVSVEVLERAKSGFLGIGASPAKVRVTYEVPDEEETPAPDEKPAEPAPAAEAAAPAPAAEKKPSNLTGNAAETERFLQGLMEHMGVAAEVIITEGEDGSINAELSGRGMGAVIGRRGETLDAIQHLTNYAVNHGSDKRCRISVDAENYRAKREESLVHLAEKMAQKVLKYKRSMALEPMNSYERHVIHTALQNFEGVSTASTGTEPNRRVVINYERPAAPQKPQSREWA